MNETDSGMKILVSYSINEDNAQAYYEFALGRYIPAMQSLGFEVSEAWHTAYGDYPNRLVGFVCRDRVTMTDTLNSDIWEALNDQLLEYVSDFSYKIIPYKIGFQI
jgi:hypothetical protein